MRTYRADVLLLVVAVVWGSSYLAAQRAAVVLGVLPVLALRFGIAALALTAVCLLSNRWRPTRAELGLGVLLGGSQAAVLALETEGVTRTSATNAGLLISLTVVLTPLLEGAAARRWLPRTFFVAVVVAVVGVALLVSADGLRAPASGDVVMLAAAFVRAVHVTASGALTRGRAVRTLTLTLVQCWVCAVGFALAAPGPVLAAAGRAGAEQWWPLAYLGLACTVFAFLVQLWAVRATSAARASLLMGTEPLWALLTGTVLAGEVLGPVAATGAACVLLGTAWGQRIELRHRTAISPTADPVAA
ncbi:MAG: Permease of the drug/metabolite transporter superfamily [Modestobacter sp.]|nr:Permease of the drug/metabolite transporter superfamily [Modestobacter sp.]